MYAHSAATVFEQYVHGSETENIRSVGDGTRATVPKCQLKTDGQNMDKSGKVKSKLLINESSNNSS